MLHGSMGSGEERQRVRERGGKEKGLERDKLSAKRVQFRNTPPEGRVATLFGLLFKSEIFNSDLNFRII